MNNKISLKSIALFCVVAGLTFQVCIAQMGLSKKVWGDSFKEVEALNAGAREALELEIAFKNVERAVRDRALLDRQLGR